MVLKAVGFTSHGLPAFAFGILFWRCPLIHPLVQQRKAESRDYSFIRSVAYSADICSRCGHPRSSHAGRARLSKDGCSTKGCACDHFVST